MTHDYHVDTVASALKARQLPKCAGLVLVAGWSWGRERSTGYDRLASDLAALDPTKLLVYDEQYLHCTIATLSSFKNADSIFSQASSDDRRRIIDAWCACLERAFRKTDLQPFELEFRSLETSPAATYLEAQDATNGMDALRAAVKDAAEDPTLNELSAEMESKYSEARGDLKATVHIPDIVHSTVMRVAAAIPSASALSEGLRKIRAKWQPATIRIEQVSLAYETHPYMHVKRAEAEVHTFPLPLASL